jgi:hypothetical protein
MQVYHLYYGNENGTPGTIMTFFLTGMPRGRKRTTHVTSFHPHKRYHYWIKRFANFMYLMMRHQSALRTSYASILKVMALG